MQKRYTAKMVRVMNAARRPLIKDGRGWRATRSPAVRNRYNTGMVVAHATATFSGAAIARLLEGPQPELAIYRGQGGTERLRLTLFGRVALKGLPQTCFKCGCVDERACPGGCSWAAPGLCTACLVVP